MIRSMTGFAASRGELAPWSWTWELRSVNAKGLDLRIRAPDWIHGLEAALRGQLSKSVARGNVTLNLKVVRGEEAGAMALNPAALVSVLEAMAETEKQAADRGVTLAPSTPGEILALRGVMEARTSEDDTAPLLAQLKSEADDLIRAFVEMRATEGRALTEVLGRQLETVHLLTEQAASVAETRKEQMASALRANLARVLEASEAADPDRVAQELALIAVKADVTEEIDRLNAHVGAAKDLLNNGGSVGRKLDFLMQEFNREANTLCAKAQSKELTAIGLELKAVIDQMREQVQNVE